MKISLLPKEDFHKIFPEFGSTPTSSNIPWKTNMTWFSISMSTGLLWLARNVSERHTIFPVRQSIAAAPAIDLPVSDLPERSSKYSFSESVALPSPATKTRFFQTRGLQAYPDCGSCVPSFDFRSQLQIGVPSLVFDARTIASIPTVMIRLPTIAGVASSCAESPVVDVMASVVAIGGMEISVLVDWLLEQQVFQPRHWVAAPISNFGMVFGLRVVLDAVIRQTALHCPERQPFQQPCWP